MIWLAFGTGLVLGFAAGAFAIGLLNLMAENR